MKTKGWRENSFQCHFHEKYWLVMEAVMKNIFYCEDEFLNIEYNAMLTFSV